MGGLEEAKKTKMKSKIERYRNKTQFQWYSRILIERHTHYNRKNRFGPHNPVQINISVGPSFSRRLEGTRSPAALASAIRYRYST
jgi:hypothetical protein